MKKHTLLLACAMRILLNLIALPFGELPRWGAKNVLPLNLIALLGCARDDDAGEIPITSHS